MEPANGDSEWTTGNQTCTGINGALTAIPMNRPIKTTDWRSSDKITVEIGGYRFNQLYRIVYKINFNNKEILFNKLCIFVVKLVINPKDIN